MLERTVVIVLLFTTALLALVTAATSALAAVERLRKRLVERGVDPCP